MSTAPTQPAESAHAARHYILGTAGHIDHGKTTLIKALTGIDTDRLPEEKRRGMTIDLGFASLVLDDCVFGIVDVPGHERFVRTMVAGATGIDLALIVVAADDSVMPQTREHVEILHLLGADRGVVAITKADTVEEEMIELVADDVQRLLAGTRLESAPLVPVSGITGMGLERLRRALRDAAEHVAPKPAEPPFRMAVDRVFTVQGRGTVITGSVQRGAVNESDFVEAFPAGATCRIRGIQTHGQSATHVSRGQRAALNLTGIEKEDLARGAELATPGYLQPAHIADVRLECLPAYHRPLKSTTVVRFEVGAMEIPARVVLLGDDRLAPGRTAYAQLRSGTPFTAVYGQRFIIRDENAFRTIGGGMILRPRARRRRRDVDAEMQSLQRLETADPLDRAEDVLRQAGFTRPTDLQLCARAGVELDEIPRLLETLRDEQRWMPIPGTDVAAVPAAIDDLADRLTRWLQRFHRNHSDRPGRPADSIQGWLERMTDRSLARPLFDLFIQRGHIKRVGRFVCLPAFAPELSAADEKLLRSMITRLRDGAFQPPTMDALATELSTDRKRLDRLATLAAAYGEIVRIDQSICLHTETERKLCDTVADLIHTHGPATVAQIRETLQSSRKYVVPFVEYLDKIGFTRRTGDHRVLSEPRAAPLDAQRQGQSERAAPQDHG